MDKTARAKEHDGFEQAKPGPVKTSAPTSALAPPKLALPRGAGTGAANCDWSPDPTTRILAERHNPNVDMPDWMQIFGGDSTKGRYALEFWSVVIGMTQNPANLSVATCEEMLHILGMARQRIAEGSDHCQYWLFGVHMDESRSDTVLTTRIFPRYAQCHGVQDFIDKLRRGNTASFGNALRATSSGPSTQWRIHAKDHRGQDIPLSAVQAGAHRATWYHQRPSPELSAQLEWLYQRAITPLQGTREHRLEALSQNVGRLHWWLAQHCLFRRGSASTYDMLSSIIFRQHGFDRAGWQPRVLPDVYALCTPSPEEFALKYRSMMGTEPTDSLPQLWE